MPGEIGTSRTNDAETARLAAAEAEVAARLDDRPVTAEAGAVTAADVLAAVAKAEAVGPLIAGSAPAAPARIHGPCRFLVNHTGVGAWPYGTVIDVEQLPEGIDLERLVALEALIPVSRDDPSGILARELARLAAYAPTPAGA